MGTLIQGAAEANGVRGEWIWDVTFVESPNCVTADDWTWKLLVKSEAMTTKTGAMCNKNSQAITLIHY
jgi:hypothetical protein